MLSKALDLLCLEHLVPLPLRLELSLEFVGLDELLLDLSGMLAPLPLLLELLARAILRSVVLLSVLYTVVGFIQHKVRLVDVGLLLRPREFVLMLIDHTASALLSL